MQEREAAGVLWDTAAIRTPFYVVDETLLKKNLEILKDTAERAGCRILLAQKAFSMYSVYPLIRQYLSGTAASGLYEARLGKTEFGGDDPVCKLRRCLLCPGGVNEQRCTLVKGVVHGHL